MESNPRNNIRNILLLDQDKILIQMVSHVEAVHMIKNGLCKLLLQTPAAIQFQLDRSEWHVFLLRAKPPQRFRNTPLWLTARQTNIYGNFRVCHPDGHMMFHCSETKALWYLGREAAEIIGTNPPTLQLNFTPGGPGHVDDVYYLTSKVNQCVVCGINQRLSRHHVMPRVFRRFMSKEIKEFSHHDVLLLCVPCHQEYEYHAAKLKRIIYDEHGLEVHADGAPPFLYEEAKVIRAARALLHRSHEIPTYIPQTKLQNYHEFQERIRVLKKTSRLGAIRAAQERFPLLVARDCVDKDLWPDLFAEEFQPIKSKFEMLMDKVRNELGKQELTREDLLEVAARSMYGAVPDGYKCYGQYVVEQLDAEQCQVFTERWRTHFLTVMNPRFLPKHWDVKKPIIRPPQRTKS